MYYCLSGLAALLIAVMLAINGGITEAYGPELATLLIHAVGFAAVSAALAIKRARPVKAAAGLPKWLFCGGVIGYFTTFFNTLAVGRISVTAILALSLLGQATTSLVIDQWGLFGMPVRRFSAPKLAGLALTCVGLVFLLGGTDSGQFMPMFVSLLTGVTVVTSRQVNAQLAGRTDFTVSTWYNYATGLVTAALGFAVASLAGGGLPSVAWDLAGRWWIYLGGAIGAAAVFLQNVCVERMSSLIMTLMMFAGQVLGGVAIDAAFYGDFSAGTLIGGVCALFGMAMNVLLDARADKKANQGPTAREGIRK